MVHKAEKDTALIISAIVIILSVVMPNPTGIGMSADSPLWTHLTYQWFHSGIIHALLNVWCLLSIVFIYNVSIFRMLTAFVVSASVPASLIGDIQVIGMSGICYALLGLLSFSVNRKLYYQVYLWSAILFGLVLPNIAVGVHAFCFAIGTFLSLLTTPIFKCHE